MPGGSGGKKDQISYFSVIYIHLMNLLELSYARDKISLQVETLWSQLEPYIDEDLEKLWKEKKRQEGEYKAMMWRVRVVMLTLYEIETLPSSNVDDEQRVFSEYEPNYSQSGAMIANELNFRDLMMRFYVLLSDLVQEGYDVSSMNYMADVGYYLCSPYITYEDVEEWKQANDSRQWHGNWQWFTNKLRVISCILDREGMQFNRRAVDQVGVGSGVPKEELIHPHVEDEQGETNIQDEGEEDKVIIKEDDYE